MKKHKSLLIIFILVISCMINIACSGGDAPAEDSADRPIHTTEPISKYDVNDIVGFYGEEINSARISVDNNNIVKVSIMKKEHADHEDTVTEWTMSGTFDDAQGILQYNNAVKTEKVISNNENWVDRDGEILSEIDSYSDGEGTFVFSEEDGQMTFTWYDREDDAGNYYDGTDYTDYIYRPDPAEILTLEDLVGLWGKPGGLPLIIDIKEDGTLVAYTYIEENYKEIMEGNYEGLISTSGTWYIDGKEVCMVFGDSEHRLHGDSKGIHETGNPFYSIKLLPSDKEYPFIS